jgi:hypothetical protein
MFGIFFTDIWYYFFPKKVSFDSIVKTSIIDPKSIKSIIGEEESLKEEDPEKSLKERNRD